MCESRVATLNAISCRRKQRDAGGRRVPSNSRKEDNQRPQKSPLSILIHLAAAWHLPSLFLREEGRHRKCWGQQPSRTTRGRPTNPQSRLGRKREGHKGSTDDRLSLPPSLPSPRLTPCCPFFCLFSLVDLFLPLSSSSSSSCQQLQ